jgi:multiple sugar transport system permease protein
MMMLAVKPADISFSTIPKFFFKPDFDAIKFTLISPGQNRPQIFNSLIIASFSVLISLPLTMFAGYSLSRYNMKGKKFIMMWYLSILMAPPIVFLIPYFIIVSNLGIRGSYLSIIILMQTVTIPFSVWLLKGFIDEIPKEIEEAAKIDGANLFQIVTKITLPLLLPGLIVTSMFAFVFAWNNAIFPLILSDSNTSTIPLGSLGHYTTSGVAWTRIAVTSVTAMIPPMLIFLALDKYVVRGLTFGSLK